MDKTISELLYEASDMTCEEFVQLYMADLVTRKTRVIAAVMMNFPNGLTVHEIMAVDERFRWYGIEGLKHGLVIYRELQCIHITDRMENAATLRVGYPVSQAEIHARMASEDPTQPAYAALVAEQKGRRWTFSDGSVMFRDGDKWGFENGDG